MMSRAAIIGPVRSAGPKAPARPGSALSESPVASRWATFGTDTPDDTPGPAVPTSPNARPGPLSVRGQRVLRSREHDLVGTDVAQR